MSEYDLHSSIDDEVALNGTTIETNTTTPGEIIDTIGFESLEFIVVDAFITNGTFTILLEEDDDAAMPAETRTLVSDDNTLGVLPVFVALTSNVIKRVGSIGKKRYQRLSIVSIGTSQSNGGFFTGIAILGHPHSSPVPQ